MHVSRLIGAFAVSLAILFTGCGGGDENSGDTGGDATNTSSAANSEPAGPTDAELLANVPLPAEKSGSPMDVVRKFLNAVREGGEDTLGGEALLTHTAILANRRAGTEFAPPGSPNAQFAVVEQELINNDTAAHVLTTWTDEGDKEFGIAPSTMDIIWVLRNEPNVGWGIKGALFKPFPDMAEPVALDFEDPDDFDKTISWINEEADRRLRVAALPNQPPPIDRAPVNGQGPNPNGQQQPPVQNGGIQ